MNGTRAFLLFLMCWFVAALGCRETPSPPIDDPTPAAPAVRALSTDDQVLLALDCYDPMYKVDATGRVTHLRLTGKHLTNAVMAEVGKLTELNGLDCYGTTVTDEGISQLKNLKKLRSIGLGATPITDKALIHLENLPSLQWVWVPRNTTSKVGIEKLKEARPDMNIYPQ